MKLFFAGTNITEIDGVSTTSMTFDSTLFERYDCEAQICIADQAVKVVNDVNVIQDSSLITTVVCDTLPESGQVEFLPYGIETNVFNFSYNGGTLDPDNPLLTGDSYTPPVNQNIHALFNLGLPDCAIIDSSYVLYDAAGSSGSVFRTYKFKYCYCNS